MAEEKQQRRVEEVAPGLVRIVDGTTYVYLSSGSPAHSSRSLAHAAMTRAGGAARAMSQQAAPNA